METRLKLRLSRILRSSFHSCKSGNPMDAVQEPVFLANHGNDLLPLLPCNEKAAAGLPLGVVVGWGCRPRRPSGSTVTAASTSASDRLDMSEDDESLVEFLHLVETRKAMLETRGKSSEGCEDEDDGSGGGKSSRRISPGAVSAVAEHAKYCGTGGQNYARRVDETDGKEELSGGEERKMEKKKKKKKKKKEKTMKIKEQRKESCRVRRKGRSRDGNLQSTSSTDSGWFSSQEDKQQRIVGGRETEALFSSKTGSSESSELGAVDGSSCVGSTSNRHQTRPRRRRERKPSRTPQLTRTTSSSSSCSSSVSCCCCPCGAGAAYSVNQKVKDSVAVVKRSSDPYSDFRESMVEMIIEKQILDHGDLKQLLDCFLSLNSQHHHPVIIEVFWEIWHALFSA